MDVASTLLALSLSAAGGAVLLATAGVRALLVTGVVAWSLGSAWFSPLPVGSGAIVGAILVTAAIARTPRRQERAREGWVVWFPLGAAILGLALSVLLPEGLAAMRDPAQIAVMGVIVVMAARRIPAPTAIPAYFTALTILAASSLAFWITGIRDPDSVSRFSGVTSNPNHLGIVAFMWVALSFGVGPRATLVASPTALALVLLSGLSTAAES